MYVEQTASTERFDDLDEIAIVKKTSWLGKLKKQFKLSNLDILCLLACSGGLVYLAVKESLLFCLFATGGLVFFSLNWLLQKVPIFGKKIGIKFHFWHFAVILTALTMLLSTFTMPAQALFLKGLEDFLTTTLTASTDITGAQITLTFNLIRAIFLILVGVAALFAYNQAQQGSDWRPIATQVAMAFGIIIAIDVITALFTT